MAPERCVTTADGIARRTVVLVARDLDGVVHARLELSREDACEWWIKVLRHWLAWRHGACEIRLMREG